MFKVKLAIKGEGVQVTVTNKDTGESRTEYTTPVFFSGEQIRYDAVEEAGRAKAEHMIRLWKIQMAKPRIIEYEVD